MERYLTVAGSPAPAYFAQAVSELLQHRLIDRHHKTRIRYLHNAYPREFIRKRICWHPRFRRFNFERKIFLNVILKKLAYFE